MKKYVGFGRLKALIADYFSLGQFLVPQEQAEASIRDGVSFRNMNLLILIAAIFIASLGLNTNSPAVIIGAMLISPLMGPIVGIGLGVGIYDFELIKRCGRNLAMAGGFSILASTLYFLISPVSEGHSELLARTSPTIYDVLIGFFGGAAGILAVGSKSKGNVIPGVAIATALMPPLCTFGYGLATLQPVYFFGALYLFIINSVYIALATFIGVKLMRYKPDSNVNPEHSRKVRRWVYCLAVIVLLPSVWMTYTVFRQNSFSMKADKFVSQEFRFPSTHVLGHKVSFKDGHGVIDVTLIGRILPVDSLKLAMNAQLRHYDLEGTQINIVQGDDGLSRPVSAVSSSADDIFRLTQKTIMSQQRVIDSLHVVQNMMHAGDSVGAVIAPELKVLFPKVRDIAVSRNVFGSVATGRLDTVNVALVSFSSPMPSAERKRFVDYLKARLRLNEISVVNVTGSVELTRLNTPDVDNAQSSAK